MPFTPYATIKDAFAMIVFLAVFAYFVFYIPNYLGHPDNYIAVDPLKTPAHIVPEWYFLPFYAILRAITFNIGPINSKLGGVLAMFAAIAVLFVVPWLDTSKVRSAVYRPWYRLFFWLFVVNAIFLGWLGSQAGGRLYIPMMQVSTLYYFAFFLVIMPVLGLIETPRRMPNSITEAVLEKNKGGLRPPGRRGRVAGDQGLMPGTARGTFRMKRILHGLAALGFVRWPAWPARAIAAGGRGGTAPPSRRISRSTRRSEQDWSSPARSAPSTRASCSAA